MDRLINIINSPLLSKQQTYLFELWLQQKNEYLNTGQHKNQEHSKLSNLDQCVLGLKIQN
jgi:hypothetical protein